MSRANITWSQIMALPAERQEQVATFRFASDHGNTIGPFFYATACDLLLFGVMAYQFFHWLRVRDSDDRKLNRYFVAWIVVVNVAETVFLMEWTVFNFVSNFDTYRQFMSMDRASWTYLIDSIVRTPVTIFYGERAWLMLNRNMFLGLAMATLGLGCVGLSIVIKVIVRKHYGSDLFQSLLYGWLTCHLVLDVMITIILFTMLWRQRAKGTEKTRYIISRALFMMLETQLPPTLFSIAFMLVAGLLRGTTWPALFAFSGKIAGNCLIAVVNHRYTIRDKMPRSDVWVYGTK